MPQDQPNSPQDRTADREARYAEFVGLLARHDLSIRRFIRSLMPGSEGVDDVLQETAMECWKKFSDFSPESPEDAANEFVRWACVIARYKAMSWQRDRSRDRLVFREGVVEALAQSALEHLDQREEERQAIQHCLSKLEESQRRLVLSVHSPGESIARIASETGEHARRLYSKLNVLRGLLLDCVSQQLSEDLGHE
jgi:RNA polymerase sigma-70 factor (ECF subfamily)